MNKVKIICHMLLSIDGKVTGNYLSNEKAKDAVNIYYQINKDYKADAFACGRVTMEESFTNKYYPDLSKYDDSCIEFIDYIYKPNIKKYAISFDRYGKLGWKNNIIIDEDEGYNNAHIIEVLTTQVSKKYLAYLRDKNISYIFAGKENLNISLAIEKLNKYFNIKTILLEGGSIINGAFFEENLVDELSLVIAPLTANSEDKSLFYKSHIESFSLVNIDKIGDVITLKYKKNAN